METSHYTQYGFNCYFGFGDTSSDESFQDEYNDIIPLNNFQLNFLISSLLLNPGIIRPYNNSQQSCEVDFQKLKMRYVIFLICSALLTCLSNFGGRVCFENSILKCQLFLSCFGIFSTHLNFIFVRAIHLLNLPFSSLILLSHKTK